MDDEKYTYRDVTDGELIYQARHKKKEAIYRPCESVKVKETDRQTERQASRKFTRTQGWLFGSRRINFSYVESSETLLLFLLHFN